MNLMVNDSSVINNIDKESLLINSYSDSYLLKLLYDRIPKYFNPFFGSFSRAFTCLFFLGAIPLLLSYGVSSLEGTLIFQEEIKIGFFEDPTNWTMTMIISFIFFLYYLLDRKFSTILFDFAKSGIIDFNKLSIKELKILKVDINNRLSGEGKFKLLYWTFIILGFLGSFYITIIYQAFLRETIIWHDFNYPFGLSVYIILFFIIIGYGLVLLLYKIISIVLSLNYICNILNQKNAFILNPFSPDKSSGLNSFAEISLSIIYIGLCPLGILTVGTFQLGLTQVSSMAIPTYIVFLAIIFILPLVSSHQLLKGKKQEVLIDFSNKINKIYRSYYKEISYKTIDKIDQAEYELNLLSNIHEKFLKSPVWPINITILGQFAAGLLLTLLPFIFEIFR